jgi:hypothetical protein
VAEKLPDAMVPEPELPSDLYVVPGIPNPGNWGVPVEVIVPLPVALPTEPELPSDLYVMPDPPNPGNWGVPVEVVGDPVLCALALPARKRTPAATQPARVLRLAIDVSPFGSIGRGRFRWRVSVAEPVPRARTEYSVRA